MRCYIYGFIKCRYPLVPIVNKENILNNKTCYDIFNNLHQSMYIDLRKSFSKLCMQ